MLSLIHISFFRFFPTVCTGGIHETNDRAMEFLRLFHKAQGFPIAFGHGAAEIAADSFLQDVYKRQVYNSSKLHPKPPNIRSIPEVSKTFSIASPVNTPEIFVVCIPLISSVPVSYTHLNICPRIKDGAMVSAITQKLFFFKWL